MSENSNIEWTDHTFNPWEGCQKVGPGCDHCYAETRNARFAGGTPVNWGPGAARRRTSASTWAKPKAWNARADAFMVAHGRRQRVFCASLADVFDNAVDPQWRADLFALIAATPNLDWLLLTKRIGNVAPMLADLAHGSDPDLPLLDMMPLPNVWLGATITSQAEADRDIPKLLALAARVRFLSMEPLLGSVDLGLQCENWTNDIVMDPETGARECCKACDYTGISNNIDWVIVGGESGSGARPMHPDWARDLSDQCAAAGVSFLFKQWGEWVPRGPESMGYPLVDGVPRIRLTDLGENGSDLGAEGHNHTWMQRAGKKVSGRLLDGRTWDGFPGRQGLPAPPHQLRPVHSRRHRPQLANTLPARASALGHLQRRGKSPALHLAGPGKEKTMTARSIDMKIKPLFLAREEAAAFLSISSALLEKLVSKGDAPQPRKLSSGRTAWLVEELEEWGRMQPVSDLPPASNSGYGRAGAPSAASASR